MLIPKLITMNWKSYLIIGAIVLVAVFVVMKLTKFEGTANPVAGDTSTKPTTLSLKPVFLKKEA